MVFIKRHFALLQIMSISLILFVTCKPGVPNRYIQPSELGDILYEYHLAEGITSLKNDTTALYYYKNNILKKHNVTSAEFDSSMVYYLRHADELKKIYEHISDRFSAEAKANGSAIGDLANSDFNSANGDTTNVWQADNGIVLTPYAPTNLYSFTLKVDSTYHKGDKLLLAFDAQFIYQDGVRDGVCVMSVTYNNDSIASQTVRMSSSSSYSMEFSDINKYGIKSIKGFFLLGNGSEINAYTSTTLRLMALRNIHLIRMHQNENKKEEKPEEEQKDSLAIRKEE